VPSAAILTIGNELVSGDVANTNAQWLAHRLEELGVAVRLVAAVPDDIDEIAGFVQREAPAVDVLVVTGGLGGTHDDVTREAIAAAFRVEQPLVADLADRLRARFPRDPEYAAQWARLPAGSRPLENPLGGAPGFLLENVFVLPGLPSEMEAMFETIAENLGGSPPIGSWRRRYRTRESVIAPVLAAASERFPTVIIGSYPNFHSDGPEVEVVVKSSDSAALEAASGWIDSALTDALGT
jgi:molybdenum cofactor synthesis domain-containing protein